MTSQYEYDIPGSRHAILYIATKFNIYFLCIMSLLSGVLFIVGVFFSGSFMNNLPQPVFLMAVGLFGFCLFFPWFTALYFARHLLWSVTCLESELKVLMSKIESSSN